MANLTARSHAPLPEPVVSDASNVQPKGQLVGESAQVSRVRGPDRRRARSGAQHDTCVDTIGAAGPPQQSANIVRVRNPERCDTAAAKKPPQLHLARGATHLRHNRSGGCRHDAGLEPGTVISPHLTVATVGSNEQARAVDAHAVRDPVARPASSSASVKCPCSRSHSATAASPSRISSARRAAAVLQAHTLMPSPATAAEARRRAPPTGCCADPATRLA